MALSTGSKVFIVILILIGGGVGGGLYYVNDQLEGEPGEGELVEIEIESGTSVSALSEQLEEAGIVKNATFFRLVAGSRGLADDLKAGTFELETGLSVDEAIEALRGGPRQQEQVRFGFAEGLAVPVTLESLAADFEERTVADFEAVLQDTMAGGDDGLSLPDWFPALDDIDTSGAPHPLTAFEGVLWPNTYDVFATATDREVLQRTVNQLAREMEAIPAEQVAALEEQGLSRYDAMIIASLIERETRVDEERPRVASVILNRLEDGMPLQIDATVLFAKGQWAERVLTSDTEIESRWNTYQVAGLPPTPISGFGRAALRAVFAPEDTDFRFYVLSPECDGSHQFAETLDEHNANVRAFRDAGGCRE